MNLLHIDSSITGANSLSREVGHLVATHALARNPALRITYRDLATTPLPHLSAGNLAASGADASGGPLDPSFDNSQAALQEFIDAEIVLIDAPMYNFTVPSQLKSWIDRILIAGKTFRYTQAGPEGLMGDKRVIIVSARGNIYSQGTPYEALDHQETWLRTVLGFMGINDVTIVRAEGGALSPQHRIDAVASAKSQIENLAF